MWSFKFNQQAWNAVPFILEETKFLEWEGTYIQELKNKQVQLLFDSFLEQSRLFGGEKKGNWTNRCEIIYL